MTNDDGRFQIRASTTERRGRWSWLRLGPSRDSALAVGIQVVMSVIMSGFGGSNAASAGIVAVFAVLLSLVVRESFVRTAAPILTLIGALSAFGSSGISSIGALAGFGFGSWVVGWLVRRGEASRRGRHIEKLARNLELRSIGLVGALTGALALLMVGATQLSVPSIALPAAILAAAVGVLAVGRLLQGSTVGGNDEEMRLGNRLRRSPAVGTLDPVVASSGEQIVATEFLDDARVPIAIEEPEGTDTTERADDA